MKLRAILFIALVCCAAGANAQKKDPFFTKDNVQTDQLMFGFSPNTNGVRFSWFFNISQTYKHNFGKNVQLSTGVSLKNLGTSNTYIATTNTIRSIERYYTIGIPVALRFGDIAKRKWFGLDGGLDLPINRKFKTWVVGDKRATKVKTKIADTWDRYNYNPIAPYVGASFCFNRIGVKYSYYLNPFMKGGQENFQTLSLFFNTGGNGGMAKGKVRKKINLKGENNTL
jgi:hypothetical protein